MDGSRLPCLIGSGADLVRAALRELRVEVRDTPSGPQWSLPPGG
jgi:hypothetical protein